MLKIDAKSGSYHAIAPGEATVTGTYAGAKEPATLRFTVANEKSAHGEQPKQVRILSDQGKTVKFPVGAEFDDFRVEAEYADGYTRVVTKKATITTPEKPEEGDRFGRKRPAAGRSGRTDAPGGTDSRASRPRNRWRSRLPGSLTPTNCGSSRPRSRCCAAKRSRSGDRLQERQVDRAPR